MYRKRAVPVVLALCVAFVSSCRDSYPGFEPERPGSFTLIDGTTTGNPHFFFLQPLGPKNAGGNPGGWAPGTSNDQTLSPIVEVLCLSDCDPASSVTFSGASVQVHETHYQADVSGNNVPLTLGGTYRITVRVAIQGGTSLPLGQVTHVIADNAQRNLSIKFRIEEQALCYNGSERLDCGTGFIDPNAGGFVVVTDENGKKVGALIAHQNYRSTPTRFLFTRRTDLPCLDTDYAQFEGCFSLTLDPALQPGELFADGTVWIGYCLDPRVRPNYAEKYKSPDLPWPPNSQGNIQALDYTNSDALVIPDGASTDCANFEATPGTTVVAMAAHRVKRALRGPIAFVFGTKLIAEDLIRYGSIRDASRFGWARLLTVATSNKAGLTGVPVDLSAVATYFASANARAAGVGHHHGEFVSGLPVIFKLNGVTLCTATTSQVGNGTCAYTFNQTGTYSIVPNVDGRDYAPFTVTIATWQATFLTPLASSNPPALPTQLTTASGSVLITCAGPGCTFATLSLPYTSRDYKGGKYQVNWKIAGVAADDLLTFQVLLGTTPLPYTSSIVVASDPKYNVGSNLPIAWRIER